MSGTDLLGGPASPGTAGDGGGAGADKESRAARSGDRLAAASLVPLWFERGLVVATAAVLSVGGVGLLLASLGHYRALPVMALGAAGTVGLSLLAWPRRADAEPPESDSAADPGAADGPQRRLTTTVPALGMCLVAVVFAAWNGLDAGHHVAIGRDPGVYLVAGKWIAGHGNLRVDTGPEWTTKDPRLSVETLGAYSEDGRRLEFQFNHLTPVLLAEADNIGGDRLMFRVPALLGALALCAIYAAGCLLVRRPWLVLAAVAALAGSLPELNVSRDTYSEPSVQLLLWSGLWLLLVALVRRRPGPALLGGLALGGTMLSRIDALVYLIPLPLLGALAYLAARPGADRRHVARTGGMVALGAAPVAVLGTIDVSVHAGRYYADLHAQVWTLQKGLAVSVVAAAVLLLGWPLVATRLTRLTGWLRRHRSAVGTAVAGVAATGLVAAWAVRPMLSHPHGTATPLVAGLQQAAGLPVDPSRTYAENTVWWLTWYLGPVTVALGIVGAAALVARTLRQPRPAEVLILTVPGLATAAYLWNPAINPDQVWATRRFVPAALPLLVLLAAVAIEAVAAEAARLRPRSGWASSAVAAGTAGLLVFPAIVTAPVRHFQAQAGYSTAVTASCRVTGPRAAILFVPGDQLGIMLPPAIRSWCGVPVAVLIGADSAQRLQRISAAWRNDGRSLWLLSSAPGLMTRAAPGVTPTPVATAVSPRELVMTIDRPPRAYWSTRLVLYAAPVNP